MSRTFVPRHSPSRAGTTPGARARSRSAKAARLGALAAAATLTLAACGGGGSTASSSGTKTHHAPASPSAASTATLTVAKTSLGNVLVGRGGHTLYVYTPDPRMKSVCTGQCIAIWPALGKAGAGSGVNAAMIGTITRPGGGTQTTYNGHPLYYFTGDQARGDTNGEGYQKIWYVMSPQGTKVVSAKSSGGSSPSPSKGGGSGGYGY